MFVLFLLDLVFIFMDVFYYTAITNHIYKFSHLYLYLWILFWLSKNIKKIPKYKMTINRLDPKTYVNVEIVEGESKYKTPLLINKELDFMLEIANPTLDVYFPSPSISEYEELAGRFDDVLYSLDFNGHRYNYDSSYNYTFDSIIVKQNPNITFNNDYSEFSSSGFVVMIERILEDTILHKLHGIDETETIQIAEIIKKLVENISKLSAKALLVKYNSPDDIIKYFNSCIKFS